jgi:hypothetical protein
MWATDVTTERQTFVVARPCVDGFESLHVEVRRAYGAAAFKKDADGMRRRRAQTEGADGAFAPSGLRGKWCGWLLTECGADAFEGEFEVVFDQARF